MLLSGTNTADTLQGLLGLTTLQTIIIGAVIGGIVGFLIGKDRIYYSIERSNRMGDEQGPNIINLSGSDRAMRGLCAFICFAFGGAAIAGAYFLSGNMKIKLAVGFCGVVFAFFGILLLKDAITGRGREAEVHYDHRQGF